MSTYSCIFNACAQCASACMPPFTAVYPRTVADSHPPAAAARTAHNRGAAQPAAAALQPPAAAPAARRRGLSLFSLPLRLLTAGIGVVTSVVHLTFTAAGLVGDRLLPAAVMRAARGGCTAAGTWEACYYASQACGRCSTYCVFQATQ